MTAPTSGDHLERLLTMATAALEAGDPESAAKAVAGAVAHLATGPAPSNLRRLLAAHSRLSELADRETERLARELSLLGTSRRASGAYRAG